MKKRTWILAAAAIVAVAALTAIGLTVSYLTDVETADNVITIGKVRAELSEGAPFDPDPTAPTAPISVVPGSVVTKAPKVTNTGSKDEYVFLKITVPKGDVTLLYDDSDPPQITDQRKGTPRAEKGIKELFRMIADDATLPITSAAPGSSDVDVDFSYHSDIDPSVVSDDPPDSTEGWILLNSDLTGENRDVYVFGYNKKLSPEGETKTLFDAVQLKSFIDGEVTGEIEVGVFCCGIQADNLPDGTVASTGAYLDQTDLTKIWTIVSKRADP